jgi:hypothetical protein
MPSRRFPSCRIHLTGAEPCPSIPGDHPFRYRSLGLLRPRRWGWKWKWRLRGHGWQCPGRRIVCRKRSGLYLQHLPIPSLRCGRGRPRPRRRDSQRPRDDGDSAQPGQATIASAMVRRGRGRGGLGLRPPSGAPAITVDEVGHQAVELAGGALGSSNNRFQEPGPT